MTIVSIGRQDSKNCMNFAFEDEIMAFGFYALAKDHYREDDLCICMTEEGSEEDEEIEISFGISDFLNYLCEDKE